MNIPTDPLSLFLIASIVFPGTFLVINTVLGFSHAHTAETGHQVGGHHAGAGHHIASHHQIAADHHDATQAVQHHGHVHFSTQSLLRYFNLNAVTAFLFTFGLIGFLLHDSLNIQLVVSMIFAIAAGIAMATGINILYLRLADAESGRLDNDSVIGCLGKVSLAIKPGHIGEVIYIGENGSRHSVGARVNGPNGYEIDTEVVITDEVHGIVTVEAWQDFLEHRPRPQTISDVHQEQ